MAASSNLDMDRIIARLATRFGVEEPSIRKGVAALLEFIRKNISTEEFATLMKLLPGAAALLAAAPAGPIRKASGLFAGALPAAAVAVNQLRAAGVPLEKAAEMAAEFMAQARALAGDEAIDSLLRQVPVLRGFVESADK